MAAALRLARGRPDSVGIEMMGAGRGRATAVGKIA